MTLPPVVTPVESPTGSGTDSGANSPRTSSDLTRALSALSDALRDASDGRPVTAAGLKVTLQRRLSNATFEKDLGFQSFRAFLSFAQAQGLIVTRPAASDLYVYLASKAPAEPDPGSAERSPVPSVRGSERLRSDIWSAFVDFHPGYIRVYDRGSKRAWKLPIVPTEAQSVAEAAVRRRLELEPDDFVVIPYIERDQQLGWMHEFAEVQGAEFPALKTALEADRPLAAFANVIRTRPLMGDAWHASLLEKVRDVVAAWAQLHGITDDLSRSAAAPDKHGGLGERVDTNAGGRGVDDSEEIIRRRILDLLAQLPTEDLLRLTVPVSSIFRR